MEQYEQILAHVVDKLRAEDQRARKSKRLSKERSDIEAMGTRKELDSFYDKVAMDIVGSLKSEVVNLPGLASASLYAEGVHDTRMHEFLDEHLLNPHAIAYFIDYLTGSRGNNLDLAKACNLFALSVPPVGGVHSERYRKSLGALLRGLGEFNLVNIATARWGYRAVSFCIG
jgi:hypothetical protein